MQETWFTEPNTFGRAIAGGKLSEKLRNTWRTVKRSSLPEKVTVVEEEFIDDEGDNLPHMYPHC